MLDIEHLSYTGGILNVNQISLQKIGKTSELAYIEAGLQKICFEL